MLAACGAQHKRPTASQQRYPVLFIQGSFRPHGVGLCPVYRDRSLSDSLATEMALRSLSWAHRVRITGQKLFQMQGAGETLFRGQDVQLADALDRSTAELDTCVLDDVVWVLANGRGDACREVGSFSDDAPDWMKTVPVEPGWTFAYGSAPLYRDEAGSWEVATYRALVELGVNRTSRLGSIERRTRGAARGATRVQIDAVLAGARVVGRWRDSRNVHVLAASPLEE